MEHDQSPTIGEPSRIVHGADDQWTALERLWTEGERSDPHDDAAWETIRRALNESRRAVGARLLFLDE